MLAGSPGPLQSASLREFLSGLPACAGEPSRDAVQQMIITQDLPYRWHPKYIVFAVLFRNCQLRMTTEESVIHPCCTAWHGSRLTSRERGRMAI